MCFVGAVVSRSGKNLSGLPFELGALMYYGFNRGHRAWGAHAVSRNGDCVILDREFGAGSSVISKKYYSRDSYPVIRAARGICHLLYSTTGDTQNRHCIQPLTTEDEPCFALAHNGEIMHANHLLKEIGKIPEADSDSHLLLPTGFADNCSVDAVFETLSRLKSVFCVVFNTPDGLIVARDGMGNRPLFMGEREDARAFSSEPRGLVFLKYQNVQMVPRGSFIFINKEGQLDDSRKLPTAQCSARCSFEYIYFMRPDTPDVYRVRYEAGKMMGSKLWKQHTLPQDAVVISVPDSGEIHAEGFSAGSGLRKVRGFIRNHGIGRVYQAPFERDELSALKLSVIPEAIRNKDVVVVDDSLLRGNSCRSYVRMLRPYVESIHWVNCSPVVTEGCNKGNAHKKGELLGERFGNDLLAMARDLNLDSLWYPSLAEYQSIFDDLGTEYCFECHGGGRPLAEIELHGERENS